MRRQLDKLVQWKPKVSKSLENSKLDNKSWPRRLKARHKLGKLSQLSWRRLKLNWRTNWLKRIWCSFIKKWRPSWLTAIMRLLTWVKRSWRESSRWRVNKLNCSCNYLKISRRCLIVWLTRMVTYTRRYLATGRLLTLKRRRSLTKNILLSILRHWLRRFLSWKKWRTWRVFTTKYNRKIMMMMNIAVCRRIFCRPFV